jgi:hypothetical protein
MDTYLKEKSSSKDSDQAENHLLVSVMDINHNKTAYLG